jgi:ABC-type transporter Mla subunit MlaD
MNRVVTGLLLGVGVVTGLVVLLTREKKTQRFLRERWQQLRSALPEPEHVGQYAQHVADRLARASSEVKDTTQQAMKKVRVVGRDLGDAAQQTSATSKQTGQDVAGNTRQMAKRG